MYEQLRGQYLSHVVNCSDCNIKPVDFWQFDGILKKCLIGQGDCHDGWHHCKYWAYWRHCKDREKILLDISLLL